MNLAKQSTAKSFLVGPILDSDGAAKTDEVVASIKVTKNGSVGAPNGSSTLTHNHTGHYIYAANAGDIDTLGEVQFSLNSGTNAMQPVKFQVVPANVYDSLVAGSDTLQTDVTHWYGGAIPGVLSAGVPYVDIGLLNGSDTAVLNMDVVFNTDFGTNYDTTNDRWEVNVDQIEKADPSDTINAACDTALSDIHLDHLLAATYDPASKPGVADALLNELIENDGGVSRFTANSLEEAPDSDTTTGLTLHGDYDAAKTAAQAGDAMTLSDGAITAAKIAASALDDKGNWNTVEPDAAGTAPTAEEIKTAIEAGGSYLALIKAVTDVLPNDGALTDIAANAARLTAERAAVLTDLIDGGRLDLILDELTTQGDTNEGLGHAISGVVDPILVDTGTTIPALIAAIAGDASAANQATIIAHLVAMKGVGWTTETLTTIEAAIAAIVAGEATNVHLEGDSLRAE